MLELLRLAPAALKRNSIVCGASPSQRFDGIGDDQLSLADDRDAVGDALHLVELMGREEHGAPIGDGLAQQPVELVLHQWVEAGRRFVEHEQLGSVHEREDQPELLAVALRQLVRRAIEDHLKAFDKFLAPRVGRRRRARGRTSRCSRRPVIRG